MQTTLLGIAIAAILALVTALVGPFFIDWNRYRPQFETEASRLLGLPVHVNGSIDVRVLPTPSLLLSGIEIGQPGSAGSLKARALGVELALGPLLRGQIRAAQTRLVGPEFSVALDKNGRIELPTAIAGVALDSVSIEHLRVDDARIALINAASDTRIVLDKLWFGGEVRSLAGLFKGEGAFVYDGDLFGYRVTTARADDNAIRVKFGIDASDRPLNAEGEGAIVYENGQPRYDGALTVLRGASAVLSGGTAVLNEPVKITTRVKATPQSALFDQLDFQYGPDERALKLTGTAEVRFGATPRINGGLAARTLDLDRLMASADAPRRRPFAALVQLAQNAGAAFSSSVPMQIGISIDSVALGGANLQNMRGEIRSHGAAWALSNVEFRAPGVTQIKLGGRLDVSGAPSFSGPMDISSGDPRGLLAWLDGRSELAIAPIKPLRGRGDVSLSVDAFAVERLSGDIDRRSFEGKFAYSFASGERKTRLDAALRAAEFDADAIIEFARAALAATKFEQPAELSLALDLDRATVAGFDAKNVAAALQWDGNGVKVDRLAVADFGGTAFSGSGRIDNSGAIPRGAMTLDIDARDWSGVNALAAKFAPQSADIVSRFTSRIGAAKLRTALDLGKDSPDQNTASARLTADGTIGALRVSLNGQGQGDASAPLSARIRVNATLDADNNAALVQTLGLDGIVPAVPGAGQFKLLLDGPANGDLTVGLRLTAGDIVAESHGNARLGLPENISGALGLMVTRGDAKRALPLPFSAQSRVTVGGGNVRFNDIVASVGPTRLRGQLDVKPGRPFDVTGKMDTDAADLAALIGNALGAPAPRSDGAWSGDPFGKGNVPDIAGRIEVKAARASLAPLPDMQDVSALVRLSPSDIALDNIAGNLAGGRVSGALTLRKRTEGVTLQSRLALKGADAKAILAGIEGNPVLGRLSLQVELDGGGLSPKALVGSLTGSGTVSMEKADIGKLDPRVFATAMRAADQGASLDPAKLREVVGPALDAGRFTLNDAEGTIAIANGQARLGTVIAQGSGAELAAAGNVNLVERTLDARLILTGAGAATSAGRPELTLALKGPLASPQRSLDVAALAGWLALRAVEQQSKKLEAIEAERANAARQPLPQAPRPQPDPVPEAKATAPREQAAPLPPPINIKPIPGPNSATRPPQPPLQPQPQSPVPSARDQWFNQMGSQR